jgi:hypothetical protein
LDGGRLYQHLALLAAARVVGVGEFEQFMVPAHCFSLSVELAQILRYRYCV